MKTQNSKHRYNLHLELESLSQLLGDYNAWFLQIMEAALYRGSGDQPVTEIPRLFIASLDEIKAGELSHKLQRNLKMLREQHDQLELMAGNILSRAGQGISQSEYQLFSGNFKTFLEGLQATCQDLILTEWGLDILTGMRNRNSMVRGVECELERLSRHGHAFSLVYLVIDNYAQQVSKLPEDAQQRDVIVQGVAECIRACIRPFDDAYYMGEGEFVLSLKQSDISGGQKALERLQQLLSNSGLKYTYQGVQQNVTLSCCVSEPLPDEDVETLVANLRSDLKSLAEETGAIVAYHEMSLLQKYVMMKE